MKKVWIAVVIVIAANLSGWTVYLNMKKKVVSSAREASIAVVSLHQKIAEVQEMSKSNENRKDVTIDGIRHFRGADCVDVDNQVESKKASWRARGFLVDGVPAGTDKESLVVSSCKDRMDTKIQLIAVKRIDNISYQWEIRLQKETSNTPEIVGFIDDLSLYGPSCGINDVFSTSTKGGDQIASGVVIHCGSGDAGAISDSWYFYSIPKQTVKFLYRCNGSYGYVANPDEPDGQAIAEPFEQDCEFSDPSSAITQ